MKTGESKNMSILKGKWIFQLTIGPTTKKNYHSSYYPAGSYSLPPSLSLELNILNSHLSQMVIFLALLKKI